MHFILVAMGVFAALDKESGLDGNLTVQSIKYCVISAQQYCTLPDLQAFPTRYEAIKISHEVRNYPVILSSIILLDNFYYEIIVFDGVSMVRSLLILSASRGTIPSGVAS
jgi:hypothetical protein